MTSITPPWVKVKATPPLAARPPLALYNLETSTDADISTPTASAAYSTTPFSRADIVDRTSPESRPSGTARGETGDLTPHSEDVWSDDRKV